MKVTITYHDHSSLTKEEVVRNAKQLFGELAEVEVHPSSTDPLDMIYFAIQQLITYEQLSLLFDEGPLYKEKIAELRANFLSRLSKELNEVIKDNELRVS